MLATYYYVLEVLDQLAVRGHPAKYVVPGYLSPQDRYNDIHVATSYVLYNIQYCT